MNQSKNMINWEELRSKIFLLPDDKISFPHLGIDIVKGCNMRCEHCSHLSPLMSGIFPTAKILKSINMWSEKIVPESIGILGGEPLLHPDLPEIIFTAWEKWNTAKITILTNGLLLENISDNFLKEISSMSRIEFVISQHLESDSWQNKIFKSVLRLSKFNIKVSLRKAYERWMIAYKRSESGKFIPYESDPAKAWNSCWGKSYYKLHGNNLWYCTRLASAIQAIEEGLFGEEWNIVAKHNAMRPDNSQDEILAYLRQKFIPECKICPETQKFIATRQLPSVDNQ